MSEIKDDDYTRATALAEGKYWDRDLDKSGKSDRDYLTNANPSFQVINYFTSTGLRGANGALEARSCSVRTGAGRCTRDQRRAASGAGRCRRRHD